jgi:hypothetical protein
VSLLRRKINGGFVVPELPMEHLYLRPKQFDFNRVVRAEEHGSSRKVLSAMTSTGVITAMMAILLAPSLWNMYAGFQLDRLEGENRMLRRQIQMVQGQISQLTTQENLIEFARRNNLQEVDDSQVAVMPASNQNEISRNLQLLQ